MYTFRKMTLELVDGEYEWMSISLWQYLEEGNIPDGWNAFFLKDDVQIELATISTFLSKEKSIIYPEINRVFRSLIHPDDIKVVVLGQDPYHNGSAVGLCFSVLPGNKINPSLRNIYNELEDEGYFPKRDGILTDWVEQGCLLLNTALTVECGVPDTHTDIWRDFTFKLIQYLASSKKLVWLLMGSKAHAYEHLLENQILVKTSHPSPFSAHKPSKTAPAFLGSGVFRDINAYLGKAAISWDARKC
jgi:uracil-DNA glycosylase